MSNRDRTVPESEWEELVMMAALQDGSWPATVFAHGDLDPYNILVSQCENKILGIIDWEFSG